MGVTSCTHAHCRTVPFCHSGHQFLTSNVSSTVQCSRVCSVIVSESEVDLPVLVPEIAK